MVFETFVSPVPGEAVYCDDTPRRADELYLAVLTSVHAHARILDVDYSDALSYPGVVTVVDEKDLPGGRNMVGVTSIKDDRVFARGKVVFFSYLGITTRGGFNNLSPLSSKKKSLLKNVLTRKYFLNIMQLFFSFN